MGAATLDIVEKAKRLRTELEKALALWRNGEITHESAIEWVDRIVKETK